jgi:hypothetical protein
MDDLGTPISYISLTAGTSVLDPAKDRVGVVAHVLAVEEFDVFDGIVVATSHEPVRHRFADADQVEEIYQRAVLLRVGWEELHELSASPAALEVEADDLVREGPSDVLKDRLRRAWDLVSGKY